ncbi:hypothetical protein SDC9_161786 [bioreactor metagenome]|uniref:Uncharacterized protein n=1 Tax=bioreactor metagenome TaxID=1076179 RepID=A0A645FM87_9ZZZZ
MISRIFGFNSIFGSEPHSCNRSGCIFFNAHDSELFVTIGTEISPTDHSERRNFSTECIDTFFIQRIGTSGFGSIGSHKISSQII